MARVKGTMTLTRKGLNLKVYAQVNNVALEFGKFYVSDYSDTLANITNPDNVTYTGSPVTKGITETELIVLLSSNLFVTGNIEYIQNYLYQDNNTILPVLSRISYTSIISDIDIRTHFLMVKDIDPASATFGQYVIFAVGCLLYDDVTEILIPITLTHGSAIDIPIRTNLREASGFPLNLLFINTQAVEIDIHNGADDSHLDIRFAHFSDISQIRQEIRDLKDFIGYPL
jgi:hypothetical protein